MNIRTINVGPIETNCYIVSEKDEAILIDPGEDAEKILKGLGGLKLNKIILTHLHFDHIIAAKEIKVNTGAKIYCHEADLEILDSGLLKKDDIDFFLKNDDMITVGQIGFKIIHTPGHTPGSFCLYNEESAVLFSGDTIFAGAIGVTHFKGGDFSKIQNSITNKLLTLPDKTLVYPGHGRPFSLGHYNDEIKDMLS